MRHKKNKSKLGMPTDQRLALVRGQVAALFEHGYINTTMPRAKAVASLAEKLITKAKKAQEEGPMQVHRIRQIQAFLGDQEMTYKLVHDVAPRYADRNGGYTRILKIGTRSGDSAKMARIELV